MDGWDENVKVEGTQGIILELSSFTEDQLKI